MSNIELKFKIADLHAKAVNRRKEEFIEEFMKHITCHEDDREGLKKLIARSFDEGVEAFVQTQIEIMEALEEEGVI